MSTTTTTTTTIITEPITLSLAHVREIKIVLKLREEGQARKQHGTHACILLRVDVVLFLGFTLNCVDCAVTVTATSKLIHLTCKVTLSEGSPLYQ